MPFNKKILFSLTLFSLSLAHAELTKESAYRVVSDKNKLPILTPALAERQTEKLVLNNGLQAYLISDPGADQSAAGVAVECGAWNDPKEYPGMAHFLEHMLFMGTATYPKEFEYMQFIFDHGGKVNAYTASDRTVYMFSINNGDFSAAFDRFSHFFLDPLLSTSCINRELHAVDQEHSKNIEHDGWRQYMIFKETGNPNHPNSGFSTGNAKTLSGIPQEALKKWYEGHYSANRMHLALVSPLPLGELRQQVINRFSHVRSFPVANQPIPAELTSAMQRGHMLYIKPVKEIKQLSLSWEVPVAFAQDIDKKVPDLIAFTLNQEGENSLVQLLKKEQIAESLHAECDRFSKDTMLFTINISLTDQGLTEIDTAIHYVFQTIARLKEEEFPIHLFDEMQTIATLNYQYQSRDDAFDSIMHTADAMPYEDLATFPEKSNIPTQFDPDFTAAFIDILKPDTCVYSVLADPAKVDIVTDRREKWMNAEYSLQKIPAQSLVAWDNAELNVKIQLPEPNPYIPTHLALVPLQTPVHDVTNPLLLQSDDSGKIYYVQDTRYKVPEVALLYTFKSPLIDNSAKSQASLLLYTRALTEQLSSTLSSASKAGLDTTIQPDKLSLKLLIQGFSEMAPSLTTHIFKKLKEVKCTKEEFEIYRISLAEDYENASKELPVKQAMNQLDSMLYNMPTKDEKAQAIKQLTFEEFQTFSSHLFESVYTQGILYGNIEQAEAASLCTSLKETLEARPYPLDKHQKNKVLLLSEERGPAKIVQNTERQGNGVLLLLQEGNFSFDRRAIQQILGTGLQHEFFDTLRTKQQTAYIAKAWNAEEQQQLLQFFAVQSSTHSAPDLLARFELFLEDYDKNLAEKITPERFESIRANIITLLEMPPEKMPLMTMQLDKLAFEYGDFNWIHKRIDSLKKLEYSQFCDVAHQLLARSNARRLAVLVEGVLPPEHDFHYELISKDEVRNLGTFVSVK